MDTTKPKYQYEKIKIVLEKLISGNTELTEYFTKSVDLTEYDSGGNLPYVDVGSISDYIVEKKLENQTTDFSMFFENVEEIYVNGDKDVQNFIVVGLFEGIQNKGGDKIEYHHSFNSWLKTESKKKWDELIDCWEGTEWRTIKKERDKREKEIYNILNKKV